MSLDTTTSGWYTEACTCQHHECPECYLRREAQGHPPLTYKEYNELKHLEDTEHTKE